MRPPRHHVDWPRCVPLVDRTRYGCCVWVKGTAGLFVMLYWLAPRMAWVLATADLRIPFIASEGVSEADVIFP